MRVCYKSSKYLSHYRQADLYCDLIRTQHTLVKDLHSADVVILHIEPRDYDALYKAYPVLARKYVIGYCVWEASELPDEYKKSISYVQEVWTCSHYCSQIFKREHQNVAYIPHVIERDTSFAPEDLDFVKWTIQYEPQCAYFLAIALLANKRKNLGTLVKVFQRAKHDMPNSRLIIKTSRTNGVSWDLNPQIIWLPDFMTQGQINALYRLASACVSAHHSEGWGLTLSDAMIFEKPVIATGYSGNLQFMNSRNSFLLECAEEHIHPEDCCGLFRSWMKWAYPDEEDIQRKLFEVYEHRDNRLVEEKVRSASEKIKSFDRSSVKQSILERLNDIEKALPSKTGRMSS